MLNSQGTVLVINDSFVSLTRRGFKYHSLFSALPHGEAGRGTDAVPRLLLATSHWDLTTGLQEMQLIRSQNLTSPSLRLPRTRHADRRRSIHAQVLDCQARSGLNGTAYTIQHFSPHKTNSYGAQNWQPTEDFLFHQIRADQPFP